MKKCPFHACVFAKMLYSMLKIENPFFVKLWNQIQHTNNLFNLLTLFSLLTC